MKKLLVLSGKGGTGKTTISSSIIALSKAEAFADCDVDAPNLHLINKFEKSPLKKDFLGGDKAVVNSQKCTGCGQCAKYCRFDSIKITDGKAFIDEYACEGCGVCQIVCKSDAIKLEKDVAGKILLYNEDRKFSTAKLKMGRGNSGKLVSEVKNTLFDVSKDKDFVVLDGSPGVGCPVMASISGVDFVLIVTEPTISGMSDLKRIAKTLSISNVHGGVCVNKCDLNSEKCQEIADWCKKEGIPFVGKISYDKLASECINKGKSIINTDSKMSEEIKEVYKTIKKLMELL